MKKFMVFVMLSGFLIIGSISKKQNDYLFNCDKIEYFVSTEQNFYDFKTIKNGDGYILLSSQKDEKFIDSNIKNIVGKTYIVQCDLNSYYEIIKSLDIKTVEKSKTSIVGFSSKFKNSVLYNDKKVNIQAYYDGKNCFIGTPLILGSY